MKRIIAIALTICILLLETPCFAYGLNATPKVSLNKFIDDVTEIEEKYDDSEMLFSTMMFKNNSEFYYIDGEDFLLSDNNGEVINAKVYNNDLKIPYEAVRLYGNEYIEKEYVNLKDLNELGFEVEFNEDTAILSKPLQTNRLIVKSKRDINELDSVDIAEGYNDLHIIQFDDEESTENALNYYNSLNYVEYAEPDMIMSVQDIDYESQETSVLDNTKLYGNHLSWGSEYIGVDDFIDTLGDNSVLPQIVVAIIDTGIILDHEFLKDRIIETGFNVSDSGELDSEYDDHGHGTHVAGIVVDNTTENVKISGYKVLNHKGSGSTLSICLAIDRAVEDDVDVINMSLGGKGSDSYFTQTVQNAINSGVIVCVAAGNNGANANNYSPASIEGCITVAAIDEESKIPIWSNYGNCVDIIAPGVNIYSSYKEEQYFGWYQTKSGTSMAAPFVSAASALILSKNPNYITDDILDVLQKNGRNIPIQERFEGLKVLYLGSIIDYYEERTATPIISLESGYYQNSISVEITCSDSEAEIYYTVDGTRASKDNGILYTEPITIDRVTSLHAAAYAPNKYKSFQASAQFYLRYLDDERNFEIEEDGTITAYYGNNDYLIVPDSVNGITVTGIGEKVFYKTSIVMIELPDTVTHIDDYSFYWCRSLVSFKAKNLVSIGDYALSRNNKLSGFDISNVESIGKYGCSHILFDEIYNEKLTEIKSGAFQHCGNLISVNFPNVTNVYPSAFSFCDYLEGINLPKVEVLGASAFEGDSRITELSFPTLTGLGANVFNLTRSLESINIPLYHGPITPYLFSYSGLRYLENENFTEIGNNAFEGSSIETLVLRNVTNIEEKAFEGCASLKVLYLPSVETIGFENEYQNFREVYNLDLLFAPKLKQIYALPYSYPSERIVAPHGWEILDEIPDKARPQLYFSDELLYAKEKRTGTIRDLTIVQTTDDFDIYNDSDSSWQRYRCQYDVFAPKDSFAEEWSVENGAFYSTDSMVNALGSSIRMKDNALKVNFSWDNLNDIEQYASNIEYGVVYKYGEINNLNINNGIKVLASNSSKQNGKTSFDYIYKNIPNNEYEQKISSRGYVCIDGMYFYSDIVISSFEEIESAVFSSPEIDKSNYQDYWINESVDFSSVDCSVLLSALVQAKMFTKAEYTKESLEELESIVNRATSVLEFGGTQGEYDTAVAAILDSINGLDSLMNYSISSFNGKDLMLINKDGKTTELTYSDFINDYCKSLDVVEDGIINAKDYAYLLKNYSE